MFRYKVQDTERKVFSRLQRMGKYKHHVYHPDSRMQYKYLIIFSSTCPSRYDRGDKMMTFLPSQGRPKNPYFLVPTSGSCTTTLWNVQTRGKRPT